MPLALRAPNIERSGASRDLHHRRGTARNARAGCKLCKPWKMTGFRTSRLEGEKFSDHRRRDAACREVGSIARGLRDDLGAACLSIAQD